MKTQPVEDTIPVVSLQTSLPAKRRVGRRAKDTGLTAGAFGNDPAISGGLSSPAGSRIGQSGVFMYDYHPAVPHDELATLTYNSGPLVGDVALKLLFSGSFWQTATNPSPQEVVDAVRAIVASPYLSELRQYGFHSITNISASIVLAPTLPGPTYDAGNVDNVIWSYIDGTGSPEPDEDGGKVIYMVFAPTGTRYSDSSAVGAHGPMDHNDTLSFDADVAWGAFVNFPNPSNHAVIDDLMQVFTHELVETISDPEGTGYLFSVTVKPGQSEIADACAGQYGEAGGQLVSSYYSKAEGTCVVPTRPFRRALVLSESDAQVGLKGPLQSGRATAPADNLCLQGTYRWTLFGLKEEATVVADVSTFVKPIVFWHVADTQIPNFPLSMTFQVNSADDPLSVFGPLPAESATVVLRADGPTLWISSIPGSGTVDLDIRCDVREQDIPETYGTDRTQLWSTSISGRERQMDARYVADTLNCWESHINRLVAVTKDIRLFIDRGDPPPSWMTVLPESERLVATATARLSQLMGGSPRSAMISPTGGIGVMATVLDAES